MTIYLPLPGLKVVDLINIIMGPYTNNQCFNFFEIIKKKFKG